MNIADCEAQSRLARRAAGVLPAAGVYPLYLRASCDPRLRGVDSRRLLVAVRLVEHAPPGRAFTVAQGCCGIDVPPGELLVALDELARVGAVEVVGDGWFRVLPREPATGEAT